MACGDGDRRYTPSRACQLRDEPPVLRDPIDHLHDQKAFVQFLLPQPVPKCLSYSRTILANLAQLRLTTRTTTRPTNLRGGQVPDSPTRKDTSNTRVYSHLHLRSAIRVTQFCARIHVCNKMGPIQIMKDLSEHGLLPQSHPCGLGTFQPHTLKDFWGRFPRTRQLKSRTTSATCSVNHAGSRYPLQATTTLHTPTLAFEKGAESNPCLHTHSSLRHQVRIATR